MRPHIAIVAPNGQNGTNWPWAKGEMHPSSIRVETTAQIRARKPMWIPRLSSKSVPNRRTVPQIAILATIRADNAPSPEATPLETLQSLRATTWRTVLARPRHRSALRGQRCDWSFPELFLQKHPKRCLRWRDGRPPLHTRPASSSALPSPSRTSSNAGA